MLLVRTYVFSLTSSKGCLHKLYGIRKAEEFRLNSPKVVRLTLQVSFAAWPMISVTWTFIWSPRSEKAAFIPITFRIGLCLVFGWLETAVILCFMQKPIDFRKHWWISCKYLIDWKCIPLYEEFTMRKHISRAVSFCFKILCKWWTNACKSKSDYLRKLRDLTRKPYFLQEGTASN